MHRALLALSLGGLLLAGGARSPLAAQTSLRAMTTQELYAEARTRAAKVSDRCSSTSRSTYLEAMSYLFAYYQVASRDGSLQSAPEFDRTIKNQFLTVLRTARKCLDMMDNSSAQMRDDGSAARVAPPPPVERVDLPEPPQTGGVAAIAPPAGFIVTPRAVWLEPGAVQQFNVSFNPALPPPLWTAYGGAITPGGLFTAGSAAGLYRVIARRGGTVDTGYVAIAGGTAPPAPPPSPGLNGEYRIQVKGSGLFWHEDGNGDRKISTRYQPNDDFTRFILELQGDGSYRIRVKASNRYLHAPGHADWTLSTLAQVEDDYTHFFLEPEADGRSFKLRQKATNRYLGQGTDLLVTNGDGLTNNDFIRFLLHR